MVKKASTKTASKTIIPSIAATGSTPSPTKIVGDLAQTSVGITGAEVQVIGLKGWTLDWKLETPDATTTDDSAYKSSLPSSKSWSVKAEYIFLTNETTQSANILQAINNPAVTQTWNFFPTVGQGLPAFTGKAYVSSMTIAGKAGAVVGLDVTLMGSGPLNFTTQAAPQANSATVTGQQAED